MTRPIPWCFASRRQYALWREAARWRDPGASGYCADCTPGYQRRMIAENRCAYPDTTFRFDADGLIEGRRPKGARNRKSQGREAA